MASSPTDRKGSNCLCCYPGIFFSKIKIFMILKRKKKQAYKIIIVLLIVQTDHISVRCSKCCHFSHKPIIFPGCSKCGHFSQTIIPSLTLTSSDGRAKNVAHLLPVMDKVPAKAVARTNHDVNTNSKKQWIKEPVLVSYNIRRIYRTRA